MITELLCHSSNDWELKVTSQYRASQAGLPGSVAEMSEPKRREGMMDWEYSFGIGLPVASANEDPGVSTLLRV